uniref:Cytochrome P450 78A4 n=1 Tax=Aegilops tauschii TaxID=37682 RepID=M8CNW7_AEGTA
MATGPEDSLLLLLLPATTLLPPLLAVLLLAASLLWLSPGGPPGVVTALSSPVAHRVMAALSRSVHGGAALMSFSVGLTRVVVSSRQDTAREILVNPAFGDRPVKDAARHLLFHRAMGFAPSGDTHWRALRRLAAAHLFGPRRVAASAPHRSSIGARMLGDVASLMARHGEVAPRRFLHAASLNHVMAVVFGKRYDDFTSQEGALVEEMVNEGYDLLGTFNWADHLPFLKWLDLPGVRRRCNRLVRQVEAYVGNIIQEHKARRASGSGIADELSGDFVDVLLGLDGEDKMSESDMIAVLWVRLGETMYSTGVPTKRSRVRLIAFKPWSCVLLIMGCTFQEMIFRGTDTVAILMEWIMARMVLHPEIQSKARVELDAVVARSAVQAGCQYVQGASRVRLANRDTEVRTTIDPRRRGPVVVLDFCGAEEASGRWTLEFVKLKKDSGVCQAD